MTESIPLPKTGTLKPTKKATLQTTPLVWDELRVMAGERFRAWMEEAGYNQMDLAYDMSFKPFKVREKWISPKRISLLMEGKLSRAPLPQEILSLACLTGHLFDPFLSELGKTLYYRLEVPASRGLKETYQRIYSYKHSVERYDQLVTFFEDVRRVMEQ
jgi:hypothetical protein